MPCTYQQQATPGHGLLTETYIIRRPHQGNEGGIRGCGDPPAASISSHRIYPTQQGHTGRGCGDPPVACIPSNRRHNPTPTTRRGTEYWTRSKHLACLFAAAALEEKQPHTYTSTHSTHTGVTPHLRAISTVMAKFSIFRPSMLRTHSSAMDFVWKSQNAKPVCAYICTKRNERQQAKRHGARKVSALSQLNTKA